MDLHVATSLELGFESLGGSDALEGQTRLAALLHDGLAGSPYAHQPAFASVDAILGGDIHALVSAGKRGGPVLLWATIGGALAGAFWGYPLGAASENLRLGLRDEAAAAVRARERASGLGLSDAARASAEEVECLLRRLEQPAPRLFYADWIVVTPRHRRSGLARLLWTSGLSAALEAGPLDGYVARTVGAHADLLEHFYCRDVGGRAYFDWMDGDVRRVAFGGTDRGPIDAALDRARRGRDPVRLTRHDDGPAR